MIENGTHFVLERLIYFPIWDVELDSKLDHHVDIGHYLT